MRFFVNLETKPKFKRPELLFHPPIPMPLHGVNPRSIMGKYEWDKLRREVYDINNDCCWACGVHRSEAQPSPWLEAHELYDIDYKKGRMRLREIVALCPLCHKYVHLRRLAALVEQRKRQPKTYQRVKAHGDALVAKYKPKPWWNVKKATKAMEKSKKKWRDWYLEYGGKRYYSRFMTPDACTSGCGDCDRMAESVWTVAY
jgi:hypothetical protein